jgi:hypothetical protein
MTGPWHDGLPPARTRTEAATMRADAALTHAMHSIARARYQLHNGGYLRDGADPTIIAAVLHAAARSMTLSPQWADVVRPPLGRHAPGFPILHRTQNEAA